LNTTGMRREKSSCVIEPGKNYLFNWDTVILYLIGGVFIYWIQMTVQTNRLYFMGDPFHFYFFATMLIDILFGSFLFVLFLYQSKMNPVLTALSYGVLMLLINRFFRILLISLCFNTPVSQVLYSAFHPISVETAMNEIDFIIQISSVLFNLKYMISAFIYDFALLLTLYILFRRWHRLFWSVLTGFFAAGFSIKIYHIIDNLVQNVAYPFGGIDLWIFIEPMGIAFFFWLGMLMFQKWEAKTAVQKKKSIENTSGQGPNAQVPEQIKRWSWGAFSLNWIWGLGNRTYLALLVFIPFVNLVMPFILGALGNEWAWRNKKWNSIDDFHRVQQQWAGWGYGLFVFSTVINLFFMAFYYSRIHSYYY